MPMLKVKKISQKSVMLQTIHDFLIKRIKYASQVTETESIKFNADIIHFIFPRILKYTNA